jgi:DNA-binding transcriptional LysR family regulator
VELRDLRALLAVVRQGSFTAAAEELGYTQSAVSQQIAALEQELDQVLLLRRPVRPTPAGVRLAEHAQRVLMRLDVARSELAQLGSGLAEVRVAACPLASPDLLAAALRDARSAQPSVRIRVHTADAPTAIQELAAGRVDLALVDGVAGPSEPLHLADAGLLTSTAVAESSLVVALPAGHPLQRRTTVDLEVLIDAPWVSIGGAAALSSRAGIQPQYAGSDLPTILSLVAAGLGVALIPASAVWRMEGVSQVPLGRPAMVHRTELLALRATSPGQELVVDGFRAAIVSRAGAAGSAQGTPESTARSHRG